MAGKSQVRGVPNNDAAALNNFGGALLDRLRQFRASIEPMNPPAQGIAGTKVGALRRSHSASTNTPLCCSSLHARKRLPDIEAKAGIQ
jgi:hypothetical protein